MRFKALSLLGLAFFLHGCGGGDDDDGGNLQPEPQEPQSGVLFPGPVANADYRTATGSQSGVTNDKGEFSFQPGVTTTFSIGDLDFPAVPAASIITPMDMAHTPDISNTKVINMVRLLMTLDQDSKPENGITITDTAKAVATQADFELSKAEFADSAAVTNLIFNGGQDTPVSGLVSVEDAQAYFEQELIDNDIPYGTIAQQDDKAIRDYLADNNLTAIAHESGMYYRIIAEGAGNSPTTSSTVEVRYKGMLLNGTVFDQTEGDDTAELDLGTLIAGWRQALPLLKQGGKGVFYLPSALGYGTSGSRAIPPNSVLIFEIELLSFH